MPLDNKTISEAIKQAKSKAGDKKFNQTVDLILDITEIDMKSPEGKIQEIVELPHDTLKPNSVHFLTRLVLSGRTVCRICTPRRRSWQPGGREHLQYQTFFLSW